MVKESTGIFSGLPGFSAETEEKEAAKAAKELKKKFAKLQAREPEFSILYVLSCLHGKPLL